MSLSTSGSGRSASSYEDQKFTVPTSISSYASSEASDEGSTRRESVYDYSQTSSTLDLMAEYPDPEALPPDLSSELLLFNIEKDGDPQIHWKMYYEFVVTKTEAYYQLLEGYLVTDNYPLRINSERVIM
jgi:hypothetical protein